MTQLGNEARDLELSDADIRDALARVPGSIDLSTGDFAIVYHPAWRHAVARLRQQQAGAAALIINQLPRSRRSAEIWRQDRRSSPTPGRRPSPA
jgi:hypothetical protein